MSPNKAMPKKRRINMSTATSYIVLKNLKDANVSDINTSHEVNASVESSASTKLEIDFHNVLLFRC